MNDREPESRVSAGFATTNQDSTARDVTPTSHLLSLPAEIRLMIYEYTFASQTVLVATKTIDLIGAGYLSRPARPSKHQHAISLLMTCRTIRKEATPTFNALITFDLTLYFDPMAAVYELGPDICRSIQAIQVDSRLARRLDERLRRGVVCHTNCQHLLPSLRHVYMRNNPCFGVLGLTHDLAIRALRLYLGHDDVQVRFGRRCNG